MGQRHQINQAPSGIDQTSFLTSQIQRAHREAEQMKRVIDQLKDLLNQRHKLISGMQAEAAMQAQVLSTLVHRHFPDGITFSEEERVACGDHNMWRTKLTPGEEGTCTIELVEISEEERPEVEKLKAEAASKLVEDAKPPKLDLELPDE